MTAFEVIILKLSVSYHNLNKEVNILLKIFFFFNHNRKPVFYLVLMRQKFLKNKREKIVLDIINWHIHRIQITDYIFKWKYRSIECHACVAEKCKQLILRTNISVLYYIQTSQYLDWLLLICLKAVFSLKETMHFIIFSGVRITHFCTIPPSHGETKVCFSNLCS